MLRYQDITQNKARVRALTTLEPDEFASLVPHFERCFLDHMREYTIDGLPRLNRRYTSYKTSPLPTIEDKLLFILVHLKQNLTQEIQGELFGMIQSDANKWLQLLRPILYHTLQTLDAIPARLAPLMEEKESSDDDGIPFFIMMARNAPSNVQ
jgi:DDE superfamily endonuclease